VPVGGYGGGGNREGLCKGPVVTVRNRSGSFSIRRQSEAEGVRVGGEASGAGGGDVRRNYKKALKKRRGPGNTRTQAAQVSGISLQAARAVHSIWPRQCRGKKRPYVEGGRENEGTKILISEDASRFR